MDNFMFNVKQLKMNEFKKYIWQLIISTSNATLEVLSLRPCPPWKVKLPGMVNTKHFLSLNSIHDKHIFNPHLLNGKCH